MERERFTTKITKEEILMIHSEFVYKDHLGEISGTMSNDGKEVRVILEGWEFSGREFDDLEPKKTETLPSRFKLHYNSLCHCEFEFKMPVLVNHKNELIQSELSVVVKLGKPDDRGGLDKEEYKMTLGYQGKQFDSSGYSGWFEEELLEIQKKLAEDVFIQSCINCQYSDYSPFGHGAFGAMMCFRNLKSEYDEVRTKKDFLGIHDRHEKFVQETSLCNEFERRVPGSGYRG